MDRTESASPRRSDVPTAAPGAEDWTGRLETIFDMAPVGIGIVDLEGRTISTNEVLRNLLGYTREEFAATSFDVFTHPDDIAANAELFSQMVHGKIDRFALEKRFIRKDGGTLWVDLTASLVRDADGNPDYAIGVTQDISERKLFESDPHAAGQRAKLQVERIPAIVYVAEPGPAGRWLYVSPQIEAILGFTAPEWMADPGLWLKQLHRQDQLSATLVGSALAEEKDLFVHRAEDKVYSDTYRLRHRNGGTVWVRDDAMMLWDSDGHGTWHGVLVDVTREKRLEERLEHQALHDSLTGLPNRKLFHDRVGQALGKHRPGQIAVLFIDLDKFKMVNDMFGHACGDEVIVAAALRIQSCARVGDMAARLGGDEFAVLIEDVSVDMAQTLADRVIDAMSQMPVEFGARTLTIGASVGVAVAGPGETAETLLRNADLAMYQAKLRSGGRQVLYEPVMYATTMSRIRLKEALQKALADGEISLVYQPIVDLSTGAVVGFESLARWSDLRLGEVPPSEFIEVAEETGLIHELGHWAIEQTCRDLSQWRSAQGAEVYASVNVSPLQLEDDTFARSVVQSLLDHGLEPSALVLEVTEGVLLLERGRQSLRELRSHGLRVSIDDFGTGYSSLSYLRQLPVDMVKIDQSFLLPLEDHSADPAFLRAIIRLAETLHLASICEGIETPDQLADVQAAGCGYGQGDYLARPGRLVDVPVTISLARR